MSNRMSVAIPSQIPYSDDHRTSRPRPSLPPVTERDCIFSSRMSSHSRMTVGAQGAFGSVGVRADVVQAVAAARTQHAPERQVGGARGGGRRLPSRSRVAWGRYHRRVRAAPGSAGAVGAAGATAGSAAAARARGRRRRRGRGRGRGRGHANGTMIARHVSCGAPGRVGEPAGEVHRLDLLQRLRQRQRPVWPFAHGARDVRAFGHGDGVVQRREQNPRRRLRQRAVGGLDRGLRGRVLLEIAERAQLVAQRPGPVLVGIEADALQRRRDRRPSTAPRSSADRGSSRSTAPARGTPAAAPARSTAGGTTASAARPAARARPPRRSPGPRR